MSDWLHLGFLSSCSSIKWHAGDVRPSTSHIHVTVHHKALSTPTAGSHVAAMLHWVATGEGDEEVHRQRPKVGPMYRCRKEKILAAKMEMQYGQGARCLSLHDTLIQIGRLMLCVGMHASSSSSPSSKSSSRPLSGTRGTNQKEEIRWHTTKANSSSSSLPP